MAALRIGLGLLTIAQVATLWPLRDLLFADAGILPRANACSELPGRLSLLCHLPDGAVEGFFVAFFLAASAFTVGLMTRVSAVLTTIGFAAFGLRDPVYLAGDQVFWNFLFLLCFSRCGAAWSVDAWWRARRGTAPIGRIPGWPRMLMIVQLCVLYGANGWNKHGPGWLEGDAFAYMLMNDRWFRFPPWVLVTSAEPLLRAATWIAWWFERLFPLVGVAAAARAVLEARGVAETPPPSRALRALRWALHVPLGVRPWLALTLVFHGTLLVLLNLGWFVPASLIAGICLLPRWPGSQPRPFSEPASAPSPSRARAGLVVAFIAWHGLAIVQGSMRGLVEATPPPLAHALQRWRMATNTGQPWRMFSGGAPRQATYLHAFGHTVEGVEVPITSILDWHRDPPRPYVGHERRRKVESRILQNRPWRSRYAAWLCRTGLDPGGRPYASITLREVAQPLPVPRRMAGAEPFDPYERFAGRRITRDLLMHSCD